MNSNLLVAGALVLSSATWFTIHVALCWGLWSRLENTKLRWLVLLPPSAWLAAVWGFQHGMRTRAVAWVLCAATYIGSLIASA